MTNYGLLGLVIILAGWVYETIAIVRAGKTPLPLPFAFLYGTGSFLLAIHSWFLDDLVFLVLNIAATLIALVNIAINLKSKKTPAKQGKR
ncbi:MAG TPA: hypothetical protein VJH24_05780 [Candidatus Bilamarchaeaceae archaeon]|nr:hypothetical protein [Candidatus Bilamarchaeaceae archaeon]